MEDIEKRLKRIELWQEKIIGELDSCSSSDHAYYSSFSVDARNELKKEHPELFNGDEE